MSLLPGQILPPGQPIGRVNPDGTVTMEQNWWLLFFNLCLQTLGNGSGLPADALIDLESADLDAIDADAIVLRQPLTNALVQAMQPSDVVTGLDDLPDLQRALLLAQDAIPPDSMPLAQPVTVIGVGASPFTYAAPFAGSVAITGGTVSAITLIRQGTSVATGLTSGLIPVSRYDQVKVTYSGTPTMTFIPGSSQ